MDRRTEPCIRRFIEIKIWLKATYTTISSVVARSPRHLERGAYARRSTGWGLTLICEDMTSQQRDSDSSCPDNPDGSYLNKNAVTTSGPGYPWASNALLLCNLAICVIFCPAKPATSCRTPLPIKHNVGAVSGPGHTSTALSITFYLAEPATSGRTPLPIELCEWS